MALTQPGAIYRHRADLLRQDRMLGEALDDLSSQIAAARTQANTGLNGPPAAPTPPTMLQVTAASGLFTATVTHNSVPPGTQYVLQYSTTANFQTPISELLTHTPDITTTWQKTLPTGTKLYFRIASKYPASPLSPWLYVGTSVAPKLISG